MDAGSTGFNIGLLRKSNTGYMIFMKILGLFALLYIFIISITLLGGAFKLFGKELADTIFQTTSNPLVALMIGIITTALIQSSSTTTSIIVGLVAAGSAAGTGLTYEAAVPMIMGANIGTSITNIIVSMGHISRNDEFRRAFAGSMLHDFFNVCSVIVILPLEIMFGVISKTGWYLQEVFQGFGGLKFGSPLKAVSQPVVNWIIHTTGDSAWLSVLVSFILLIIALRYIVKIIKSMVLAKVEIFFQRYVFRTPILGFMLGAILTVMVQSSSITTSMVVPLLGAGVITMSQIYPYLLGANIGTTITAFLASFVTGSPAAVSVASAHLFFNILGIMIFWPLKVIPMWLANKLSVMTQKSKLVPIAYMAVVFFMIPGLIIYLLG